MKQKLIIFLKNILRKFFNRDFLFFEANSKIIHTPDNIIIVKERDDSSRYLPVHYTYHTPKEWHLCYHISGNLEGTLYYSLKLPNKTPFCEIEQQVKLPFDWTVTLEGQVLVGNGVNLDSKESIPTDALQLIAEFKFISREGIMYRKTGHRIKLEEGTPDKEYFYGNIYSSYESESSHFSQEILSKIEEFHPLKGKLLDIGCATGLLVEYALSLGLDAEGIEYSDWAVDRANKRTHGRCHQLDFDKAQKSNFPNSYDIITLHSVLEHLERPELALELLFEICNPGGVVYIQTLNSESLMHQIMKNDWGGYTDYTHKSPWISASWIANIAQKKGYEVAFLTRKLVWNDNLFDDVWQSFSTLLQIYPLSTLLEEQFGDIIEVILRRPPSDS